MEKNEDWKVFKEEDIESINNFFISKKNEKTKKFLLAVSSINNFKMLSSIVFCKEARNGKQYKNYQVRKN